MAAIVDETGHDVPNGQGGILVIKRPWPAMIRTIWGDPERFRKSYYPDELGGKLYLAGDGSVRDKKTGYFTIMGRIDDVLNVSGPPARHDGDRVGAGREPDGRRGRGRRPSRRPDRRGGLRVRRAEAARGRPAPRRDKIAKELRDWVGKEIGPIAKPKDIRFGDNLPKTRSGKIMRRLLRSIAKGEDDHAGHLDAGESGDPGAAEAGAVDAGRAIRQTARRVHLRMRRPRPSRATAGRCTICDDACRTPACDHAACWLVQLILAISPAWR